MTNDENVSQAPLPESEAFQEPQRFEPLPAPLSAQSQLPGELVDALIGADVGHSRSVQVEAFFGPETMEETQARDVTIQRNVTVPAQLSLQPQQAQQLLPRDASEGDEVDVPATEDGRPVPYVLETFNRQEIALSLAVDEGESFTLHEPWPDAANVTNVTDEEATIHLEPGAEEGDTLAWIQNWGEVTEVVSVGETEIVLRHTPPEGLTYEQRDPRSGQAIPTEVVEVTEEEVVLEQTNPHPLAGEPIVFDVEVVDRRQSQQPSVQR